MWSDADPGEEEAAGEKEEGLLGAGGVLGSLELVESSFRSSSSAGASTLLPLFFATAASLDPSTHAAVSIPSQIVLVNIHDWERTACADSAAVPRREATATPCCE